MRKKYPQLTANLPSNPLPASFEVTPQRAEDVKVIAADLRAEKFAGVEKVKDGQQTVEADPAGRQVDLDRLPRDGDRVADRLGAS